MSRLFFPALRPKPTHLLWLAWLRALQPLRPACSRTTTFLWLVLVLAALCLRPDLAGVTSLVRSLGLTDPCYYCLLHFFHSPALPLAALTAADAPVMELHQLIMLLTKTTLTAAGYLQHDHGEWRTWRINNDQHRNEPTD